MTTHQSQKIQILTEDGVTLGGTHYLANDAKTTLIINGATAVPQYFYRHFAEYFKNKGWHVVTYDLRGTGESRPKSLLGYEAQASDWGLFDIPAALSWVQTNLCSDTIFFVGHSAGGQQAGLLKNSGAINAMLTVSSQSGYWKLQGNNEKYKVYFITTVLMPLLCRVYGYFPWSKFANSEDLATGIALQWARWCRLPGYLLDDESLPSERYAQFKAPVLAYSIEDDNWGTARSVDAMMSAYPNVERHHLIPHEHGLNRLGHMGYFRKESKPLWHIAFDWLSNHARAA